MTVDRSSMSFSNEVVRQKLLLEVWDLKEVPVKLPELVETTLINLESFLLRNNQSLCDLPRLLPQLKERIYHVKNGEIKKFPDLVEKINQVIKSKTFQNIKSKHSQKPILSTVINEKVDDKQSKIHVSKSRNNSNVSIEDDKDRVIFCEYTDLGGIRIDECVIRTKNGVKYLDPIKTLKVLEKKFDNTGYPSSVQTRKEYFQLIDKFEGETEVPKFNALGSLLNTPKLNKLGGAQFKYKNFVMDIPSAIDVDLLRFSVLSLNSDSLYNKKKYKTKDDVLKQIFTVIDNPHIFKETIKLLSQATFAKTCVLVFLKFCNEKLDFFTSQALTQDVHIKVSIDRDGHKQVVLEFTALYGIFDLKEARESKQTSFLRYMKVIRNIALTKKILENTDRQKFALHDLYSNFFKSRKQAEEF